MAKILKFNNYSKVFESNFTEEELETLRKKMNKPKASEDNLIQAMIWKLQEGEFGEFDPRDIDEQAAIHYLKQMVK